MMTRLKTFAAAFGLIGLASCVEPKVEEYFDNSPNSSYSIFQAFLGHIQQNYIYDFSYSKIITGGFRNLYRLDPHLQIRDNLNNYELTGLGWEKAIPKPENSDFKSYASMITEYLPQITELSSYLRLANRQSIYDVFMRGIINELDGFSNYWNPVQSKALLNEILGSNDIGMKYFFTSNGLRILNVDALSPADKAGIKPGDIIQTINGTALIEGNKETIQNKLSFKPGTSLVVSLIRAQEHLNKEIILPLKSNQTVDFKLKGSIGILTINGFNSTTTKDVRTALGQNPQISSLILDLRNNPGGLLDAGLEIADLFLDQGTILQMKYKDKDKNFAYAEAGHIFSGPIVTLINGKSASAAEVLSSALQDNNRSVIIGTSSYGKGSIQKTFPLPNEAKITITSAEFFSPSGIRLHKRGAIPNLCTSLGIDTVKIGLKNNTYISPLALAQDLPQENENHIKDIRAMCPARSDKNPQDMELATYILQNAKLYKRSLFNALSAFGSKKRAKNL